MAAANVHVEVPKWTMTHPTQVLASLSPWYIETHLPHALLCYLQREYHLLIQIEALLHATLRCLDRTMQSKIAETVQDRKTIWVVYLPS
jgi:hypothetical protein